LSNFTKIALMTAAVVAAAPAASLAAMEAGPIPLGQNNRSGSRGVNMHPHNVRMQRKRDVLRKIARKSRRRNLRKGA
jgi:hypothetical protein